MFDLRDLDRPIVGAPMAGGPSTPELAAAVTNAGGLGFLAAGYRSPEDLERQLERVSSLTSGPVGVNLFVPDDHRPDTAALDAYRVSLLADASRLAVEPGVPKADDDGWLAKLDVVQSLRPAVVSFTFGCPEASVFAMLAEAGILTVATVTTPAEAALAVARGAGTLAIQGPDAGGHRGTFDQQAEPTDQPLSATLAAVRALTGVPLVVGGGVSTPDDVVRLLAQSADAVQVGTALLLADEAGTNPLHRSAMSQFAGTSLTRAYTGRVARGLTNRFISEHANAPTGYPQVHHLTAPLRAAAISKGDPEVAHFWAGTGFASAEPGPAAAIVERIFGTDRRF